MTPALPPPSRTLFEFGRRAWFESPKGDPTGLNISYNVYPTGLNKEVIMDPLNSFFSTFFNILKINHFLATLCIV